MRRFVICALVLTSVACSSPSSERTEPSPSVPTSPARAPTHTCARFGTVPVAGGTYVFQNNVWNSMQPQCASVEETRGAWSITRAAFDLSTNGAPASYPSIYIGCHFGRCSTQNPLPIQVSKLGAVRSSWSTTQVDAGAYNVAYDIWTDSSPHTSEAPDGSEIMIWLNSRGGVQPAGSKIATASIAGASWDVWTARMDGWNYIAYRRTAGIASVTDIDIRAFILDSVKRGSTKAAWYLIAIEAGFEIWKGGRGLGSSAFSANASAA